jgi:hypothetical protein
MDMRSPLPPPAAPARQALAAKSARKATSGTSANRAARKATSSHDSATTHKSSRRKGATNDTTKSTTDNQQDAALDFAAMLAQNAAPPATPTKTPSTAKDAKGSDPLGADTGSALLRPQGLTAIIAPGAEGDTATMATADAADQANAANAADAAAKPAVEIETAGAAAADSAATNGPDGTAMSVPSELLSAASNVTTTTEGVAGLHRRDARDTAKTDDLSPTTAPAPEISDVATTAASGSADAASTSSEQSTGDQPGTGQQQPDLTGATAVAGVQHSATGGTDAVSEAPMPAHTVAPTIAQVAQSLRTSGDGTSRLVIRLDPVELGPVLISLRTRGGAVDISVRADNAGGAAAVADQRAHIQQVLAEHGLDLSSFSVSGGEASGGAGSSTTDQGTSDSSGDGGQNGNTGPDANAASYADVQAQANGADGQAGDRPAFAAPQDSVDAFRTSAPISSTDGAAEAAVRTVRREGTWL